MVDRRGSGVSLKTMVTALGASARVDPAGGVDDTASACALAGIAPASAAKARAATKTPAASAGRAVRRARSDRINRSPPGHGRCLRLRTRSNTTASNSERGSGEPDSSNQAGTPEDHADHTQCVGGVCLVAAR